MYYKVIAETKKIGSSLDLENRFNIFTDLMYTNRVDITASILFPKEDKWETKANVWVTFKPDMLDFINSATSPEIDREEFKKQIALAMFSKLGIIVEEIVETNKEK